MYLVYQQWIVICSRGILDSIEDEIKSILWQWPRWDSQRNCLDSSLLHLPHSVERRHYHSQQTTANYIDRDLTGWARKTGRWHVLLAFHRKINSKYYVRNFNQTFGHPSIPFCIQNFYCVAEIPREPPRAHSLVFRPIPSCQLSFRKERHHIWQARIVRNNDKDIWRCVEDLHLGYRGDSVWEGNVHHRTELVERCSLVVAWGS